MKWNYTTFHNLAAAAVSLTAMILTIIYVKELREEFMPEVPRAFERLKTFYLAECIRLSALIFAFDVLVIIYHTPLIPFLKYRLGLSSEAATYENSTFGNLVLVLTLQFLTKVFGCGLLCFFQLMTIRELSKIISQYIWTVEQIKKGEELEAYKTMVTIVFVLNILLILMWLAYSGYQCYIARNAGKPTERELSVYQNIPPTDTTST